MQTSTHRTAKFIWLFLLIVCSPACFQSENSHGNTSADPPGNVLRVDIDFDFGPFNPTSVDCSGSTHLFPFIYSFLCVPNPEGNLEPDLAVSWDYDPETFTWQIRLRQDACFHNGDPVTAIDAVYSIQSKIENQKQNLGDLIRKIKATDKYLLQIQMEQDAPAFLSSIWDMEIIPDLNRHANLDLNDLPVGSGPFKFHGRTDDGGIVLTANEDYYNGRPAIDEVIFNYIPQREDSWIRLLNGKTDIVGNLTVQDYKMTEQYADQFYFSKYYYNYYSILLYNTHHPLFENPMVRRALTHAINRDYIVNNILNGYAEVIAGPMDNRSAWHDPTLKPLAYDPHLALDYLEKAGWTLDPDTHCQVKDGQMFEFELLLPSASEIDLRIARYIMLNLNEVGIRAHLKALPPDVFHKRYFHNMAFDAALVELTSNPRRLEDVLGLWITYGDEVSAAGGFASPETDHLANLILSTKSPDIKKIRLQHFDHLIADLQPGSFLFRKMSIDAMSKRFSLKYPFSYDYQGFFRMQFARLKNE